MISLPSLLAPNQVFLPFISSSSFCFVNFSKLLFCRLHLFLWHSLAFAAVQPATRSITTDGHHQPALRELLRLGHLFFKSIESLFVALPEHPHHAAPLPLCHLLPIGDARHAAVGIHNERAKLVLQTHALS
jgi:hypothetical protein